MEIKIIVLERVLKWLVGGDAFRLITSMVGKLMDEDKTNDEKRAEVKNVVMPYLTVIGQFILSTAIAFAVDKAKIEIEKSSNGS